MPKQARVSMLDYPLLSGKPLKEATEQDLNAEAKTDTEVEAIVIEIATTGIEEFTLNEPEKAARLATHLARCVELSSLRKLASAYDEW